MSDTPELRPGPPWAMEEMILAEPGLVRPILTDPAAAEAAARVRAAADAGEPVVLIGCGTAEHAAMAGAALLREAGATTAVARDAFEAALDPQPGGVLLAVSHEAGTPATLAALRAAAGDAILITARPERAPRGGAAVRPGTAPWHAASPTPGGEDRGAAAAGAAPAGPLVIGTPLVDRSWCHTVGYLSPLLALLAIAAHVAGAPPDADAVGRLVDATLARRDDLARAARGLAGCERLIVCASGADEVTARELALKAEEGLHMPTTPLGLEKVLHGHLPACDAGTGLVVLRADRRAAERRDLRAADVLRAAAELGLRSVVIGRAGAEAARTAEVVALADEPALPPVAAALVEGALAAQLLTLGLVMAAGTNPDLIRRDQEPYRAAAAAAEGRTAHLDPIA